MPKVFDDSSSGLDQAGAVEDRSMELVPAILHVDMDAFFASVELLDRPELIGRPVIVGGTGRRGVVASCTYEARQCGVRSAMPMFRARQLCPTATVLEARHERYAELSEQLRQIFLSVTPTVEPIGLDEAFLDVTGSKRLLGSPGFMARCLRARVTDELSLRCSVGIGRSKLMAKLASKAAKPKVSRQGIEVGSGVHIVDAQEELAFLHPLPIEALWGVGPATATRLRRLGITTIADIARADRGLLIRLLGRVQGEHLAALALGNDPSPVVADRVAKSIGHEQTFATDLTDPALLGAKIVAMSDSVAEALAREELTGRTVTLKVRFADFTTLTRSHTLDVGLDAGPAVAAVAGALLEALDLISGVRLAGVSVSGLSPKTTVRQLAFGFDESTSDPTSLGENTQASWEAVSQAVGSIRSRFGRAAVGPASALGEHQPGSDRWGPSGAQRST